MLDITHTASGAAIGAKIDNVYLVIFLSIVLHFALDKIPHFWPKTTKSKAIVYVISYILTIIFLAYIFFIPIENKANIFVGAITGFTIDILLLITPFVKNTKVANWHSIRQTHISKPVYLFFDILVILISLLIIFQW